MTGRLNNIASVASGWAKDIKRAGAHGARRERKVRWVLLALVHAIRSDTLDSLAETLMPWVREQVTKTDALTEPAAHDRLSEAVWEMAVPAEDIEDAARLGIQFDERSLVTDPEELAALRLPDSYSGIGG